MNNLYLIKSSSYNLTNEYIKSISNDIDNISYFSLLDTGIKEVLDEAAAQSLFSDKRIIIVKDVKYFGGKFLYEEETELLTSYFKNNNPDTILIFICDAILKSKILTKNAIAYKAVVEEIKNLTDTEVIEHVNAYAKENNFKIEIPAINQLIKNCTIKKDRDPAYINYDIIIKELEKLSLISNDIKLADVLEYSININNDITFDFSNAVISKNFEKAFPLLDQLLNDGAEIIALIGLLASSYIGMYTCLSASQSGLSDEEIAKKMGYSSTSRVYVQKKNAKIYTLDDLSEIIINLCSLDEKIKTGLNPVYGFKDFLLSL